MSTFPIIDFVLSMCYGSLVITMLQIEAIELVYNSISINKLLSHSTLDSAFSKATNSDSMVDFAMQVYLDDFQDTTPLASVNTYPLVGFTSYVSEIQLALQYPYNIAE